MVNSIQSVKISLPNSEVILADLPCELQYNVAVLVCPHAENLKIAVQNKLKSNN